MKLFKRTLSLLLVLVMVLGFVSVGGPVFAAASTEEPSVIESSDSEDVVGMTVNVESSVITIKINRVGLGGTATLYRMDANEYAAGDTISGKSEEIAATGTVIGEYSCGTTQEFHINRYLSDGSDNLYDKYYLIQDGTILCGPVYASEISSIRNKPAFITDTKKGLTLEDSETIDILKEMGASNTVINMDLSELVVATEGPNGEPRDLSSRTDLIEFESNGKTFYFRSDYIKLQDGLISAYTKAGMNVTLVLISWQEMLTNDYPRSMMYFEQTNRQTVAFNTANERGMEYWIATMEFLADRYSKSSNLGLVQKFIVGNEIDYTYDWYLLEPLEPDDQGNYKGTAVDFDVFMEEYARTLRLADLAVKKYNASGKVLVSLTHNWALNSAEGYKSGAKSVRWNSYRPKEICDWLVKYETARGNYNWGLAVHPYPINTYTPNPLITDTNGYNGLYHPCTGDPDTSAWITVSNLEVYQLYLQRPENRYKGQVRTVSLTETSVLSTKPTDPNYELSQKQQAAAIAMTYYRAANIPCIDQIAYFQPHDQTGTNYMLGLMTADGVKKDVYDLWKYIDTDKTFAYSNKYLKYLDPDATSYQEVMSTISSNFNWDTMWDEDNIITRTTEAGDSERTLSVNKNKFKADEPILVTATGDVGDTVELFLGTDDIANAEPLYSYPVVGSHGNMKYRSGRTYDLVAYGEMSISRSKAATLKAGEYVLVLRRGDTNATISTKITIEEDYSMGSTQYGLNTNKDVYKSGENILVYATSNKDCWVGLYRVDDAYGTGNKTSIFWYYNNDPASGSISGKPTVLQNQIHNNDSSNPSTVLAPGEYVLYLFDGSIGTYHVVMSKRITVEEGAMEPLTGITFKMDDETNGFANGIVVITKSDENDVATDCVMYWADENGKPLEGFTSLGKFKLTGKRTVYQMPTHTVVPNGAKKLIAYASDGYAKSNEYVSVDLPANCTYDLTEKPLVEFQVVSDVHVTTKAGATGEVRLSNQHFTMMLEDIIANSPESMGIFINGDIANTGKAAEFDMVLELYDAASQKGRLPQIHMSIGNHDWINGNPGDQFQMYATLFNNNLKEQPEHVYYEEELGGYHFIYLGGEQPGLRALLSKEQLTWFDNRMAEITAEDPEKPVFVFLHQSFYNTVAGSLPGQGWDGVANENALKAVMEKYGQIVYFNGHSHWELNSESNMYPGDMEAPVAFNTASVGYLWTSYDIMGGEFMDGTQGYFVRVYEDKIVFLGRDFENQLFIPSATYVVQRNNIESVEDTYEVVLNKTALDLGAYAEGSNVTYTSSDTDVLNVTDDGVVIARKPGTAKVTITAEATNTTVITKKTIVINVVEDVNEYVVTFKDWDGTVISEVTYRHGDTVKVPAAPSRAADEAFTYTFAGWDKPVVICEGNAVYTAQYTKTPIEPEVEEEEKDEVTRVFGDTRYTTSTDVADELKRLMGVEKFECVVVASGMEFADALSGSYLAAMKNAPVLLVRNRDIEMNKLKEYIKANLVPGGTVYLLGGQKAIPASMEKGLEAFNVKRLGGATRYETNLLILKEAGVQGKDVVVCSGRGFADSLSASATGLPILLVKDDLSESQKEFLAQTSGNFTIVGGTAVVNQRIERQLASVGTVKNRLAGNTRYETSVLVAKEFFAEPDGMVVVYGQAFPDGLSGGPLAYHLKTPMILATSDKATAAANYAASNNIHTGYVLGGSILIRDSAVRKIFAMAADDVILVK